MLVDTLNVFKTTASLYNLSVLIEEGGDAAAEADMAYSTDTIIDGKIYYALDIWAV